MRCQRLLNLRADNINGIRRIRSQRLAHQVKVSLGINSKDVRSNVQEYLSWEIFEKLPALGREGRSAEGSRPARPW